MSLYPWFNLHDMNSEIQETTMENSTGVSELSQKTHPWFNDLSPSQTRELTSLILHTEYSKPYVLLTHQLRQSHFDCQRKMNYTTEIFLHKKLTTPKFLTGFRHTLTINVSHPRRVKTLQFGNPRIERADLLLSSCRFESGRDR